MAKRLNDLPAAAQMAIAIGLPALLAAAAYWYYVKPLSEHEEKLRRDVKALEAQNLRDRAFQLQRAEYVKRMADSELQLEVLRRDVPDEENTDGVIDLVHEAATSAGVHVRSFVAQPEEAREAYIALPFKLRVDGTYYALLSFFDRLARASRIVNVEDLSLGSPAPAGMGLYTISSEETVGANCLLVTYFNRPPPPGPAKKK